jgi:hypothetical protein
VSGSQPPVDPEGRRSGSGLYVSAGSGELEFERVAFFSYLRRIDQRLMGLNLLFLALVAAQVMWGVIAIFRNVLRRRIQSALSRSRPSPA